MVHIFIGSRIAILVEKGSELSGRDKAINILSMVVGGAVGLAVGFVIYRRTMARAAAISMEQGDAEEGRAVFSADDHTNGYADAENNGLLDPEDAAAVMDDDDISMWGDMDDNFDDDDQHKNH